MYYNLLDRYRWSDNMDLVTGLDASGNASVFQSFLNYKYRVNEKLTLITGLHYMRFNLNGNNVTEPRVSASYQLHHRHVVSAGFGLHSRLETISQYFAQGDDSLTTGVPVNRNLDFSKARHYVIGYKFSISPNLRFNTELYYQELYNVPIENRGGSNFSLLNSQESYSSRTLVNEGTGTNYGVDMTLEKYFSKRYYFLITNSLYRSTYMAMDGIERSSRYNGQHVTHVLAGKEFDISRKGKKRAITLNTKATYAGGTHYTPIDLEKSIAAGKEVRDESRAYAMRAADYKRFDISVKIRTDKGKTAREWKLDVQNVTNSSNVSNVYYDAYTQSVVEDTQLGLLPVMSYKIIF
jgi:hypothetical protein